jgi:endogenous inhibitor of DNA gyrase (YacG/DUF329 family)
MPSDPVKIPADPAPNPEAAPEEQVLTVTFRPTLLAISAPCQKCGAQVVTGDLSLIQILQAGGAPKINGGCPKCHAPVSLKHDPPRIVTPERAPARAPLQSLDLSKLRPR